MAALGGLDNPVAVDDLASNILNSRCPFKALGLTANTTLAEVKTAYRRLSLVFHPDKSTLPAQLAIEVFQALQRAYTAASQQFKPFQQPAAVNRDIWGQFYAPPAPTAQPDTGFQAATASGLGAAPRPAHAARQGSLWGSARGPLASSWSRQNMSTAPAAPSEPAAAYAAPGVPGQQEGVTDWRSAHARSTGRPKVASAPSSSAAATTTTTTSAAAQPCQIRGTVPAAAFKPVQTKARAESSDEQEPPADANSSPRGWTTPADKRRRVAADGTSAAGALPRPAKAPATGLVELLRKRRTATGPRQGPACPGPGGPGSPRPGGPKAEHAGGPFLNMAMANEEEEEAGGLPQRALAPNAASAQGPHAASTWARRPVFGVPARHAPHLSVFAEPDGESPRGSCGEAQPQQPRQHGRPRSAAAAALEGGGRLGRARARERLAPASPGRSSEDYSMGDDEAEPSEGIDDDGVPSPLSSPSPSRSCDSSSSDSEGTWDKGPLAAGRNAGGMADGGGCAVRAAPIAAPRERSTSAAATGQWLAARPRNSVGRGDMSSEPDARERQEGQVEVEASAAEAAQPAGSGWRPCGGATGGRGSTGHGRLWARSPLAPAGAADCYDPRPRDTVARGGADAAPVGPRASRSPCAAALQREAVGVPRKAGVARVDAEAHVDAQPQEGPAAGRRQPDARKVTNAVLSSSFYGPLRAPRASPPPCPPRPQGEGGVIRPTPRLPPAPPPRSEPATTRDGPVTGAADKEPEAYGSGVRARPGRAGACADGWGGGGAVAGLGEAPVAVDASKDRLRLPAGGAADGVDALGQAEDQEGEGCEIIFDDGAGHCAEGGDADPEDAWWDEPLPGHPDDPERPVGLEAVHRQLQGADAAAGPQTLDMFLQQVQRGGELLAQRAGQMRLSNLRRTAIRGHRGKARGRGSTRGGVASSSKTAASKGRGGGSSKGGRGGTADILRYSRPIKG